MAWRAWTVSSFPGHATTNGNNHRACPRTPRDVIPRPPRPKWTSSDWTARRSTCTYYLSQFTFASFWPSTTIHCTLTAAFVSRRPPSPAALETGCVGGCAAGTVHELWVILSGYTAVDVILVEPCVQTGNTAGASVAVLPSVKKNYL